MKISPLPRLMVAPNGARKGKYDHPALPITIEEIMKTAKASHAAGADGIHAHVRDGNGEHILDAGLYRELIVELERKVPDLVVQITTEAVGKYSPPEQMQLVRDVMPECVSVSLKELHSDRNAEDCPSFYAWAAGEGIAIQHIAYSVEDLALLESAPTDFGPLQILYVLGRYVENQESNPELLDPFLNWLKHAEVAVDWAVCAFGKRETDCLAYAIRQGGKVRVGFENSFWNADGSLAKDNAERVAEIRKLMSS